MWLIFYFCQDQLKQLLSDFIDLKPKWLGPILYMVLIAVWSVIMLPQTVVEVGAGAIWGIWFGSLVGLVGKVAGSSACFFISRRWGSKLVQARIEKSDTHVLLKTLSYLIARRPHFFTFLVCAAFVPASLKSYGLGTLRAVPYLTYLLYCVLCGIPFCLLNAFIGASASDVGSALEDTGGGKDEGGAGIATKVAAGVGVGFTVLLVLAFGYYTKKTLDRHIREAKERMSEEEGNAGTEDNDQEGGGGGAARKSPAEDTGMIVSPMQGTNYGATGEESRAGV